MGTNPVSCWLREISNVTEYRSRGLKLTVRVICTECGRTLNPNEQVRALSISGLNLTHESEQQQIFHDICAQCYSTIKLEMDYKMR